MKKRVLALLLAMLVLLTGCAETEHPADGKTQLWIVTEQTTWDQMNGQAEVVIKAFEEANAGVTVKLDILPTGEQERSVYLQQLRTQILQGGGPDGYLLPTDNDLITDEPKQYTYVEVEPLFVDVELAMRNGLFYDISAFYDADVTLGKEALNETVMDAGVVSGSRYLLPLRYDMPVIFADVQALQAAGLDQQLLRQDILTVMEAVLQSGDGLLAGGVRHESFSAFSDLIDYRSGNILLQEDTLARYLEVYQQLQAICVPDNYRDSDLRAAAERAGDRVLVLGEKLELNNYIWQGYDQESTLVLDRDTEAQLQVQMILRYYPLYVGNLQDALAYAPVARQSGKEFVIAPMRSVGGDVVATVTYYAAVGSGSDEPELTYEFLRQFLLEESQFELNRPTRKHTRAYKGVSSNTSNDLQYPGLIGSGWPVRDEGSVKHMWQSRRMQIYKRSARTPLMRKIGLSELEEEWVPLFDVQIDEVRFHNTLSESFASTLEQLNDGENANAPTQADTRELAWKLLWDMRWYVSEG